MPPAAARRPDPVVRAGCAAAEPGADRAARPLGIAPRQGLGAGDPAGDRGPGRARRSAGRDPVGPRRPVPDPDAGRGAVRRQRPPSPLSARSGFFGSRPFSRANELLVARRRRAGGLDPARRERLRPAGRRPRAGTWHRSPGPWHSTDHVRRGSRSPGRGAYSRRVRRRAAQPRAWSRSAIRSSTSSMPTLSRTRSPGTSSGRAGDRGVGHLAGVLDQRLDAAQGLAEGEHLRPGAEVERRLLTAGDPEADHAAVAPHLPLRPGRGRGGTSRPGIEHLGDLAVPDRNAATCSALSQCRSIRTAAYAGRAAPARSRTGRRSPPMAFWWKRRFSARASSLTTSAPPTTSEWPPQYFVVECTTTSAPRVRGCCR